MRLRLSSWLMLLAAGGCFTPSTNDPSAEAETDPTRSSTATASTGMGTNLVTSVSASEPTTPTATTDTPSTVTQSSTGVSDSEPTSATGDTGNASSSTGTRALPLCGDGIPVAGEFCFDARALVYAAGGQPVDVATADLTDNGVLDIVTVGRGDTSSNLTVLEADGIGGFVTGDTPTIDGRAAQLAVADIDDDGDNDIVILTDSNIRLFRNNGQFFLSTAVASSFGASWEVSDLVVADLDGDGVLDVATTEAYDQSLRIGALTAAGWTLDANATSLPVVGEGASGIVAGTLAFDADADIDIIAFNQYYGEARVMTNDGAAGFSAVGDDPSLCPQNVGVRFGALGDFNNDGQTDLVVTCVNGDVVVALDDGTGTFADTAALALAGAWRPLAADIDGDGDTDIAVTSAALDRAVVYLNDGTGAFTLSDTQFTANGPVHGIALADLNDDTVVDIVIAGFGGAEGGEVLVYLATP